MTGGISQRGTAELLVYKYVCITTNQPDTKTNPNPNPKS